MRMIHFGSLLGLTLMPWLALAAEVQLILEPGFAEPLTHRSLAAAQDEALTKEVFAEIFREQIAFQYAVNTSGEWCRMAQFAEDGSTPEEELRAEFADELKKAEEAEKDAAKIDEEEDPEAAARAKLKAVKQREKVQTKIEKARARQAKPLAKVGRTPTLEEAWTRYQEGGRFIVRRPEGSQRAVCPECKGEGRVKVDRPEAGLTGTDERRNRGVIGGEAMKQKSIVCPTCRGLTFVRERTGWRYGILSLPEKEAPKVDRANLTSFLGFPLGSEISPSRVDVAKYVNGIEMRDVLPEQDFLQFAGYLVGVCPGTLTVHSVVAYDVSLTDPLVSTFNAVSESLRATYGEACEVKQEDANTLRFVFKTNPDRQIVLSRKELKRKKTKAQPQTKAYWIFLQASDAQLQRGNLALPTGKRSSGRLSDEKLKKASEMF